MPFRIVQKGSPPFVCIRLAGPGADTDGDGIGQLDEAIAAALPDTTIVASGKKDAPLTAARVIAGANTHTPFVLVGYSAGCQGVRQDLVNGAEPVAVVTIDGTHASKPPASWQLDVWRTLAAEARRGERLWVATCTLQRYVERLAQPYLATSTVLAQVLGLPELAALKPDTLQRPRADHPRPVALEHHDGGMHLLAYGGTDCDNPAHGAQLTSVLPDMLARFVRPWLVAARGELDTVAPTDPAPAPPAPWHDLSLSLGERCVLWCESEMRAGVREEPAGSNTSPRIAEYLAPCVRGPAAAPLNLRAAEWCAAAQCAAQWACSVTTEAGGFSFVHEYRASGVEIEADAKKSGAWHAPSRVPRRGDLCILRRVGSDPSAASWARHVCRVVDIGPETFTTIGGNEGHAWRVTLRRRDDPAIVGFVAYP